MLPSSSRNLSVLMKTWVLSQLPSSFELQSLVLSEFLSSNLVSASKIHPYRLDSSRLHWKYAFDSAQHRMETYLEATTRLLEDFHKRLIVVRVDERLTLGIYENLGEDFKALEVAIKRFKDARLVFTTCIEAALGLLRNEIFSVVIVDEAS